jgi:hypothetical protein
MVPAALFALALVFGLNLYFSLNSNINDPIVNPLVPLMKDAFFATVITFYVLMRWEDAKRLAPRIDMLALGLFVALVCALTVWHFGVNRISASLCKNLLLYLFGGYFVGTLLIRDVGADAVVHALVVALCISIVASILLLLHPVQSYDGRLYGTYGNPTSLGFAAVVLAALTMWLNRWSVAATVACAVLSVMTGSASVMLGTCLLFVGIAAHELMRGRTALPPLHLLVIYATLFVVVGYAWKLAGLPAFGFHRLEQFFAAPGTIATSDSVTVRMSDFAAARAVLSYHRYDSFGLSLWRNFGLLPVLVYASFLTIVAVAFLTSARTYRDGILMALFGVLFVVNPVLQHQLEIFPTNGLFALAAALAAFQFRASAPVSDDKPRQWPDWARLGRRVDNEDVTESRATAKRKA